MALSIVGALITAALVAVAAQLARERGSLAADVRALRAELRQLADALAAERSARTGPDAVAGNEVDPAAAHRDGGEATQPGRGPRTLH